MTSGNAKFHSPVQTYIEVLQQDMEMPQPGMSPYGDQNFSGGFENKIFPGPNGNNPDSAPPPPGLMPNYGPSAPSLSEMQKFQGYENITFDDEVITPPTAPDWEEEKPLRKDITGIAPLTEDQVHEALLEYVASHCCYGKGVANDMIIEQIKMSNVFHYTLETFGEKRESAWNFEPFTGQAIDGPSNGQAPGPWDVPIYPSNNFVDGKTKVEVPHTAFVKPCHECVGIGRVRCTHCNGSGGSRCTWCHGSGHSSDQRCTSCQGSGHRRCFHCNATGQTKCKTCKGRGSLKNFVQLSVTWTNHFDDYISDTSNLPKEEIRKVSGDIVFEEDNARVWAITHSGDVKVNAASKELTQKHSHQFTNERILSQRHCLRIIPIAEIDYYWKRKKDQFYVSGFERKVYFKKYPQNCCCCCTIM